MIWVLGCAVPAEPGYTLVFPEEADAWVYHAVPGSRLGAAVTAADLDEDGDDELIVGTEPTGEVGAEVSKTWVLDGADLTVRASYDFAASNLVVGQGPALLAYSGWDPATERATLYRVGNPLGTLRTRYLVGTERLNDLALTDYTGDGEDDLIVATTWEKAEITIYDRIPASLDDAPAVRLGPVDFGFSAVAVVDVDGDGVGEVLGGATHVDDPDAEVRMSQGAVYVFDGDARSDVALEDARAVYYGAAWDDADRGLWHEGFTGERIEPGGDLDGDGLPEVLVGGNVWLWAAPLAARGAQNLDDVAVTRIAGEDGVWDRPGRSSATVDLDGDDRLDLAVGAPRARVEGLRAGAVYLLHGPLAGAVDLGSAASVKLAADSANDELGAALAVVSRGGAPVALAIGAPGTQSGSNGEAGALWLWGVETLEGLRP